MLLEPAGNVKHFSNVVAGAATDTVGFFGNADEHGFHVQKFERGVKLFGFGDGSAVVGFAGHDKRRSLHLADKIGEGTLHVIVSVFPGQRGKPVFCDEGNVRSEREAVPVDDRIERRGGAVTGGVLDGPAGEDAAAAAARGKKIVGVDVALGDDGVYAAVHVVKIVAGIRVMDKVGKFLAITRAAARICVQNDVTHRGPDLLLEIEAVAVIAEGAAVNLQDQRIFLGGIEIRRGNVPALDFAFVFRRFVPNFFDVTGLFLREEFLVHRGEYFHRSHVVDSDVTGIVRPAVDPGDAGGG